LDEWNITSLAEDRNDASPVKSQFCDRCTAFIFRYGNDTVLARAKERVLQKKETEAETPLEYVKRIVGETLSFPVDASYTLQCTVFCDAPATLSRPLAPFASTAANGTVTVRGVSRPVDWDVELPQVMRVTGLAPHTHVWAFSGLGPMTSLFNNSESSVELANVPVTRLFFFPTMRVWVLFDRRSLFAEGTHEDLGIRVTSDTLVELGGSQVSMRCELGGGVVMMWSCNDRFDNDVPERVLGSVITRIDVARLSPPG
jgi:hypothetical protein